MLLLTPEVVSLSRSALLPERLSHSGLPLRRVCCLLPQVKVTLGGQNPNYSFGCFLMLLSLVDPCFSSFSVVENL